MEKILIKEAIDLAIQREIEAEKLYEKLMNLTSNSKAKILFDDLRKMEIGHRRKLENLDIEKFKEKHTNHVTIDYKMSDSLVAKKADEVTTFQDGLILAAHNEKQAYELYNQLASEFSTGEEMNTLFQSLAKEELGHKKHVELIYDDEILKNN